MEQEIVSGRVQRYPRDLLKRFGAGAGSDHEPMEVGEGGGGGGGGGGGVGEMELSLGLSLGGCFGVERPREKRLVRSSSVSIFPAEQELFPAVAPLARTCSLPTETEEELRKRKELQSLKRMEAKRKRLEKRLSSSYSKQGSKDSIRDEVMDEVMGDGLRGGGRTTIGSANGVFRPVALPPWSVGAVRAGAQLRDGSKCSAPASQRSIGSQGSSSSSVSDVENRTKQGFDFSGLKNSSEARSHSTSSLLTEESNLIGPIETSATAGKPLTSAREEEDGSRKVDARTNGVTKEVEKSMMEEMPCVSTKGDGPDGIRIEGFLYKYRKGEEVRIVCLCHGSFFTPAEFVKHAGGGEVAHPLRHIVVNASPSTLF